MSIRSLSAFVAAGLLTLAGCSGGGDDTASGGESAAQESSSAGPTYTAFEDFPGDELVAVEVGAPVGLRTKVVDAAWLTELAGSTAEAGSHFLTVYVAVTGELDDRGVDDAKFNALYLGLRSGASADDCNANPIEQPAEGYCVSNARLTTQLEAVPDDQWREHAWQESAFTGVPMEIGDTLIGAIAFPITDDTEIAGDTEFCATDREEMVMSYAHCVPIPKLDERG